jgi:hypothetical protein
MESTKITKVKKLLLALLLPLLVACGSKSPSIPPQKEVEINIPSSCEVSNAFSAIKKEIPDSQFIDTKWAPAPNTELADFLENGGLACTYGVASAQIGATIRWVKDSKNNYEKWIPEWSKEGYQRVNLATFGVSDGYFLQKAQSTTQEFHLWILNFKSGGVWVSINRSSGESLNAGAGLIEAVLTQ